MSIGLLGISEAWVTSARSARQLEADWVGQQFVQAIGSYYESSPGGRKTYPASLNDLVEDRRGLVIRRHLRRIYLNPFSGTADWEPVLSPIGGIRGVRLPEGSGLPAPATRVYEFKPVEPAPPSRREARP